MQKVKADDVVKVHYKGSLEGGHVFDSSENREPLEFKVGAGLVIQGFDDAVLGMEVSESKTITILPDQAYGPHDSKLVQELPKNILSEDIIPKVGMELESPNPARVRPQVEPSRGIRSARTTSRWTGRRSGNCGRVATGGCDSSR